MRKGRGSGPGAARHVNGRICEMRGVEDSLGQLRQLGYELVEPGKPAGA